MSLIPRQILMGLDGSEPSVHAFSWVSSKGGARGCAYACRPARGGFSCVHAPVHDLSKAGMPALAAYMHPVSIGLQVYRRTSLAEGAVQTVPQPGDLDMGLNETGVHTP